ncbi:1574_t:CDS:2 [Paraglomus brasilianum]|uniref:1574_t:CDS:1 n=1 Tax=Paraglomus brasilianum TaxID=144538 RepID=A0A9N8ZMI7_9GLOM|nr:1574_t:CDS:2 [Paraglomus brasilianum]
MFGQFRSQWPLITISLLFLLTIVRSTKGANIISFCKCSCIGKPPQIIPLSQTNAKNECANCTRAFCEEQLGKDFCGLKTIEGNPIDDNSCGTEFTATCFERDSYKDEAIVYMYIVITTGLLFAAIAKPFLSHWRKKRL